MEIPQSGQWGVRRTLRQDRQDGVCRVKRGTKESKNQKRKTNNQKRYQRWAAQDDGGFSSNHSSANRGKLQHRSRTWASSFRRRAWSLEALRAWCTKSAMTAISGSFMPRVVRAGVPTRLPLVMVGGRESKGMGFLFTVMPARSRVSSASLPVSPVGARSTRIRWVSVPPDT